jgi:DNA-binding NtrC family response regulator
LARILVVDDEPDVRRSLQDLLRCLPDCEVEVARNYAEGRAKAALDGWDAVITDERLPDGRGVDILAEVARTHPDVPRVLMSAFSDFDMMLRGVNAAHIDHFIQKPWDPAVVLDWVKRTLDARARGVPRSVAVRSGPFRRVGGQGGRIG